MSSNKKQKLDFKDALKAKGARPASEAAVVEVHGVPTTIIRGDMSDSAWSQIKARELPEKAIQRYEETGSLPSPKPGGKMTTVPDDGAGGPRADSQRTEHVEPPGMGMAVSARNPAGIISQLATGATPQDVSQAPTNLADTDMGIAPADAMAAAHTPDSAEETPPQNPAYPADYEQGQSAPVEETPPQNPAYPADYEQKPGVRTLEPMTMDAGGPPPEEPFKLPSVEEGAADLTQAKLKALDKAHEVAQKQLQYEKKIREQHELDMLEFDAHQKELQAVRDSAMDDLDRAGLDIRNMMLEHAKTSIDPNRYWSSKDAGQKAASFVMGALYGFAGEGNKWIQKVDSLIAQDIQAQAADMANRGHMLQAAASQNNNLIAQLKARGVEGMAARQAGIALMKESLANRLELMKLNTSDPNSLANLEEKKAQLLSDASINAQKAKQAQEVHAANLAKTWAETKKLRADAKGGGGSGRPLGEVTIARHDAIKNSLEGLEELKAAYDRLKSGSLLDNAGQVIKAGTPLWESAEAELNAQRDLLAGDIAKARSMTGSTSENDEAKAVRALFGAGDPNGDAKYKLVKRDLERRLKQSEASLAAAGFDTSSTAAQSGMAPLRPPMKASK